MDSPHAPTATTTGVRADERHYNEWMGWIPTPNPQTTRTAVTARVILKLCMNSPVGGDATRSSVDILAAVL